MKFKKFKTALLASVMTLAICLGMTGTAFAADPVPTPAGTEGAPASAALTKELQVPEGTAIPATMSFNFDFTKVGIGAKTDTATIASMPTISKSLNMSTATKVTPAPNAGLDTYVLNTGNLFPTVNATTFPAGAGEYIYTVTETDASYTIADAAKETVTYSKAVYEMHVYVANGAAAGALYIKSVGVIPVKDDAGVDVPTAGTKVDPTNPTTGTGTSTAFKFVNKYVYTKGGGVIPTDPGSKDSKALEISKMVTGDLASKTEFFSFDVTLANSSLINEILPVVNKYKAYICTPGTNNNYVLAPAADVDGQYTDATPYIEVTVGAPTAIKLKHGQSIVFMDLPVGNTYIANEAIATNYTPSIALTVNGGTPTAINGTINTALATSTDPLLIGAGTNLAAYTNSITDTPPTGIILNNLPFFIMILVAVGGLTGYIAMKRRNKEER